MKSIKFTLSTIIFVNLFNLNLVFGSQILDLLPKQRYKIDENAYVKKYTAKYYPLAKKKHVDAFITNLVKARRELEKGNYIVDNLPELERYLQSILDKLLQNSDIKDKNIRVYIANDYDINAFVIDDEVILITLGIISNTSSEAEIASILAHELGHIENNHLFNNFILSKKRTNVADVSSVAASALFGFGVGVLVSASIISSIYSFSRDNEREADSYSLKLLKRSGYSQLGLVNSMKYFIFDQNRSSIQIDSPSNPFTFWNFSTHPDSKERLEYTLNNINNTILGVKYSVVDSIIFREHLLNSNIALTKFMSKMDYRYHFRILQAYKTYLISSTSDTVALLQLSEQLSNLIILSETASNSPFLTGNYNIVTNKSKQVSDRVINSIQYNSDKILMPEEKLNELIQSKRYIKKDSILYYTNLEAVNHFLEKSNEVGCQLCKEYLQSAKDKSQKIMPAKVSLEKKSKRLVVILNNDEATDKDVKEGAGYIYNSVKSYFSDNTDILYSLQLPDDISRLLMDYSNFVAVKTNFDIKKSSGTKNQVFTTYNYHLKNFLNDNNYKEIMIVDNFTTERREFISGEYFPWFITWINYINLENETGVNTLYRHATLKYDDIEYRIYKEIKRANRNFNKITKVK